MALSSNDWFQQLKHYVHAVVGQNLSVIEGTVTSRQSSPPSVKVMLQPYEIETGWIRVGTPYAGNGFGFLAIPPEGQAVKVIFDMGDKTSATVVCDVFNDVDVAPTLASVDDAVFIHSSGSTLYFHAAGEVAVTAQSTLVLNGGTAGVARVGDTVTVTGTDSRGDSFTATGTIQSGASTVMA